MSLAALCTSIVLAGASQEPAPVPTFDIKLTGVSLARACEAIVEASGMPLIAEGEARMHAATTPRPVHLEVGDATYWDAVLTLCDAADVGLAPPSANGEVRLGAAYPRPTHAWVDGPTLVELVASGRAGERAGTLRVRARLAPRPGRLRARAAQPLFSAGKDWEG